MWTKLEFTMADVVQSHGSQTSPDFSMVDDTLLCNLFQSFVLISFGCFVYPRLSIVCHTRLLLPSAIPSQVRA